MGTGSLYPSWSNGYDAALRRLRSRFDSWWGDMEFINKLISTMNQRLARVQGSSARSLEIELVQSSSYLDLQADVSFHLRSTVHRTVEVTNSLLVDLDVCGRPIGIEKINGDITFYDLQTVIESATFGPTGDPGQPETCCSHHVPSGSSHPGWCSSSRFDGCEPCCSKCPDYDRSY